MQHFKYKLIAAVSAAAIALPLRAEKNDASSKDKPPREQAKNQVIMPRVDVIGAPENLEHISGSANVLDKKTLEKTGFSPSTRHYAKCLAFTPAMKRDWGCALISEFAA
ncbi:MAG: hypothetical protein U1D41_11980 [Nitrosomonas sp.]|uniref:hypothetical protein n=1 Tax=Nitrosomonas sp. TaxID=42353 RepID=UPI002735F908|nr:hypothetical protein [Nitrosomonas sp.]MDP3663180.1 hypothetical protein [Nitrosomonas sp.]MDZ4106858.1 hypothetical protein [Nitrosomonas sp.]